MQKGFTRKEAGKRGIKADFIYLTEFGQSPVAKDNLTLLILDSAAAPPPPRPWKIILEGVVRFDHVVFKMPHDI